MYGVEDDTKKKFFVSLKKLRKLQFCAKPSIKLIQISYKIAAL